MRVGVLISGRGSNLDALLRAFPAGHQIVHICWVGTNRPQCAGLQYARSAGLPVHLFPRSAYADRQAQQLAISRALEQEGIQLVVLAGFDQIVTAPLLQPFEGRVIQGEAGLDVGDRVNVKLIHTDPERAFIDFAKVSLRPVS